MNTHNPILEVLTTLIKPNKNKYFITNPLAYNITHHHATYTVSLPTNYLQNKIYKHQKIRIWNWRFEFKGLNQFKDHHSSQNQLLPFLKTDTHCIIISNDSICHVLTHMHMILQHTASTLHKNSVHTKFVVLPPCFWNTWSSLQRSQKFSRGYDSWITISQHCTKKWSELFCSRHPQKVGKWH